MRTQRAGARLALAVAAMFAVLGVFASGAAAQSDTTSTTAPTITAPQASATVTGQPTVSGTLEDESIRVLIDNCELGTAEVFIDGISVAIVTLTGDASATATGADFEAAASSSVVVAIPDGATPPYQVTVVCENGTADTLVTVPVVQVPDEDAEAPQEEGGAGGGTGDGGGSLPLTGGGDTLVPLARGAAVAIAVGALMILATRRRQTVTA